MMLFYDTDRRNALAYWLWVLVAPMLLGPNAPAQIVRETVFFDVPTNIAKAPNPLPTAQLEAMPGYPADANRMTLIALLYHPDSTVSGPGPYPAVVVLHGSGGMWSSDTITNGPSSQFQKWGTLLAGRGYLVLIPDSYNVRGIPAGFANRRPHHDSAIDDSACSPNYERPKDVVAALTFLNDRADVDKAHVGLLGFSHGSETGLNSILDASVDRGNYTVDYVNTNSQTIKLAVPSPIRIPGTLPFPRVGIFYYPGCGLFSYHGSPNSMAAGRYMPDRRTQVIMYHGTSDALMGVTNPAAFPKSGNLYPIKFVTTAGAQAATQGISNPFVQHYIFDFVNHSYDETTIESRQNWNTVAESNDEKANRLSQDETLKWLAFRLHDHPLAPARDPYVAGGNVVQWFGHDRLRYELHSRTNLLAAWAPQGPLLTGSNTLLNASVPLLFQQALFYRLRIEPMPAPTTDPLYTSFFLEYSDFSY